MEALIELVAASLARQGVECPDGTSKPAWNRGTNPVQPVEPIPPIVLPEHSYRKLAEGDPAP